MKISSLEERSIQHAKLVSTYKIVQVWFNGKTKCSLFNNSPQREWTLRKTLTLNRSTQRSFNQTTSFWLWRSPRKAVQGHIRTLKGEAVSPPTNKDVSVSLSTMVRLSREKFHKLIPWDHYVSPRASALASSLVGWQCTSQSLTLLIKANGLGDNYSEPTTKPSRQGPKAG